MGRGNGESRKSHTVVLLQKAICLGHFFLERERNMFDP